MLKLQLVRANGFPPKEDMADMHGKVAELLWKKEQVAQEKLHMTRTLKHEGLQTGEGMCLSRTLLTAATHYLEIRCLKQHMPDAEQLLTSAIPEVDCSLSRQCQVC